MDKLLEQRRDLIKTFLEERQGFPNEDHPHLRDILSMDQEKNHFLLSTVGWDQAEFVCELFFYIELEDDGIILIHENKTDVLVDDFFIENGISESEIIYAKNKLIEDALETVV